jgi:phage terminase small subunit
VSEAPGSKPLENAKRESFCQEFIVDKNKTQAAIRAGYSAKTAGSQAHDLLKNPEIEARIEFLLALQQKRTEITADRVLKELARIAFLDLAGAYDENGRLLPIKDMPEDVRRAIAGMKVYAERISGGDGDDDEIGETTEIKTVDKTKALQLIGQHLKMFTEKREITGSLKLEDLVMGGGSEPSE